MANNCKILNQRELVRMFKDFHLFQTDSNTFCFLLGAGASKSSGIQTGWELSKIWLEELKEDFEGDSLKMAQLDGINDKNAGEHYTKLYELRYGSNPDLGYGEFIHLMAGKEPGLAYAIFAQILASGQHRFVITTNFDHLVEDAVRMYTSEKPFIAGHETLAGFISLEAKRPTIFKVHRDLFLHPANTDLETATLKNEWKKALTPLLKKFHLLVLGYGGNDGSLREYLKEIKDERLSLYWCTLKNHTINSDIEAVLREDDFLVEIEDFDHLMFALYEALGFTLFRNMDHPDDHPFVIAAKERIKKLEDDRIQLAASLSKNDLSATDTIPDSVKGILSGGVSEILLNARLETDPQKKEAIYQKGLDKYPKDADLLANYAGFLYSTGKTDEGAEKYRQAITIKPDFHEAYTNWGNDLGNLAKTKTGDEAEALYREAFEKYEQAVTLKPDLHEAYNNWGICLGNLAETKSGAEAETLYRKAFEKYRQSAELGGDCYNLACLYALRSENKQALKYLERSLANNEITAAYVKQDTDWESYLADDDFIALLHRFE